MTNPPFKVKAVYEYASPHEDDLHFPNGQIISVTEEEGDDWYVGEYVDDSGVKKEGLFPRNFVEKYEPTAPPRPVRNARAKKEVEHVPEPTPAPVVEQTRYGKEPEQDLEPEEHQETPVPGEVSPSSPKPQPAPVRVQETAPPPPVGASKPGLSAAKAPPPPVSEKPASGSFKDRIAAFNKAAPPVAPFKPGALSSGGANNFIKKPFVAPPPSKNAYVPTPREPAPQKIYRREEDPEIAARNLENLEQAERAGLASSTNDGDEDQPKPTSLKERIALLQKQQMEQAARHADAAAKKEKPKRPVKKRTGSSDLPDGTEQGEGSPLERRDTEETLGKLSMDSVREEQSTPRRRKSSRGAATTPGLEPRGSYGDGNEADMSGAGDTTEEPEEISTGRDDSDEKPRSRAPPPPARVSTAPRREPDVGEEEGASEEGESEAPDEEEEEEDEEDEDIDPEIRRKEELRARMAKMSGGMGMHGMFGPPGGMPLPMTSAPPKKKKTIANSEGRSEDHGAEETSQSTRAPPVPVMISLPGLSRVRSPEESNKQLEHDDRRSSISASRPADEVPDVEEVVPLPDRAAPPAGMVTKTRKKSAADLRIVPSHSGSAPPIPSGRPAPPVPKETRPPPPAPMDTESGSDDELADSTHNLSLATPSAQAPRPPSRQIPEALTSPRSPTAKRASYFGYEPAGPSSPTTPGAGKRLSRAPPPIPRPAVAVQSRAPPPPPPGASLSRAPIGDQGTVLAHQHTTQDESEEEITEYEGDYDTDIASGAAHKDALKSHGRELSLDDTSSARSPATSPSSAPPPLPPNSPPRAVPPPLPSQPPPVRRQSVDTPRAAPPAPPPPKVPAPWEQDDDEYDPYKYTAPTHGATSYNVHSPEAENDEEDLYSASPVRAHTSQFHDRPAPPPPPREVAPPPAPSSTRSVPRPSQDIQRSATSAKRSVELSRISMDSGYVANDVDLAPNTFWWMQPNSTPPVFQNRKDILHETEESTSSKRGGKTTITKELYVLFQDYSQTIITATYDTQNPSDVKFLQRHEPPPSRLRQDQLEHAYEQFGRKIAEAMASKRESLIGDGTPQGLVQELLKPFSNALLPVGSRAYGAVVYGNLANASTQQNDEIRPGDIITLRNTKFQGKHGPMHAKYSMEVGKPDHVAVVAEWDGTKKKVRAWEQGREKEGGGKKEKEKVKMESYKLDDLRSGEVKIWRSCQGVGLGGKGRIDGCIWTIMTRRAWGGGDGVTGVELLLGERVEKV